MTVQTTASFPAARLVTAGQPIEVTLVAQLQPGAGDHLYAGVQRRQTGHATFEDRLEEPAARIGDVHAAHGDPSALHSFVVGPQGHPFHRHASPRQFTAIAGSGGARLYFSEASEEELRTNPALFWHRLRVVEVPPDGLFTVRFGVGIWHRFTPQVPALGHPAFFALSCHPNEWGGTLPFGPCHQGVEQPSTVASLTELLPAAAMTHPAAEACLRQAPTMRLSLDAPPGSFQHRFCQQVRHGLGHAHGVWARWRARGGGFWQAQRPWQVSESPALAVDSLLHAHLSPSDHQDAFTVTVKDAGWASQDAAALLAAVLEGFVAAPPHGVTRLMAWRNTLVRPWGLRTSPLGCPVSSLLSTDHMRLFAGRFPVKDQRVSALDQHAQVILGTDDKHVAFRSCVSVRRLDDRHFEVGLATRVHCKNGWGRLYWALIDRTHRRYVSPALLRAALNRAFVQPVLTEAVI
jgi:hypothetical protein